MGIVVSGGGGSDRTRFLLDLLFSFNGPNGPTAFPASGWVLRNGAFPATAMLTINPSGASSSGIAPIGTFKVGGFNSAAARATIELLGQNIGAIPLGRQFGGAAAPDIQGIRGLYRYTCIVPVRSPTRGTAEIQVGLCVDNGMLGLSGALAAAVFSSRVAVNGGAWTPRVRAADAGAIADGPSSGVIADATWRNIGFQFTELPGNNSRLDFIIDDQTQFSVGGAALPQTPVAPANNNYRLFLGMSGIAGTEVQFADYQYTVEVIG